MLVSDPGRSPANLTHRHDLKIFKELWILSSNRHHKS